jgi:hypothetical protein
MREREKIYHEQGSSTHPQVESMKYAKRGIKEQETWQPLIQSEGG